MTYARVFDNVRRARDHHPQAAQLVACSRPPHDRTRRAHERVEPERHEPSPHRRRCRHHRRRDGSLRRPGRSGSSATATGSSSGPLTGAPPTGSATPSPPEPGQIVTGGTAYDATFTGADNGDLASVDAAYRLKYGQYASIVDHLEGDGPLAATLQVHPAWPPIQSDHEQAAAQVGASSP
jgi:hypothetical protein